MSRIRKGAGIFLVSDENSIIDYQVKFFALGEQFLVIQRLCQQDLRFKTFYDLTGSGGRAGLAALFLQPWSSVVSLENSRANIELAAEARRLVRRVQPRGTLATSTWRIENITFTEADWIEADVVLLDGTVFERLDEGVICRYFEERLRTLQAGSFVVAFTRCSDQLLVGDNLRLVYSNAREYTTADGRERKTFYSWLFKTLLHRNDSRVGVSCATKSDDG
ncbi:unnamed protein product [Scytosiphon promiscuus]